MSRSEFVGRERVVLLESELAERADSQSSSLLTIVRSRLYNNTVGSNTKAGPHPSSVSPRV